MGPVGLFLVKPKTTRGSGHGLGPVALLNGNSTRFVQGRLGVPAAGITSRPYRICRKLIKDEVVPGQWPIGFFCMR